MVRTRKIKLSDKNTNLKILGLDCSSSTVGWGLVTVEEKPILLSHGHIKPLNSQHNIFVRLEDIYQKIGDLCMELDPSHIAIEDIVLHMSGKSSAKTITTLAIFNRIAGLSVYIHTGVTAELFAVGTIRKSIRQAHPNVDPKYKKEDIPSIIRTYLDPKFDDIINKNNNVAKETYDEADGIAVAWSYAIQLGNEYESI